MSREEGATVGSMSDLGNESLQNMLALGQMKGDTDQGDRSGGSATAPGAIAQSKAGASAGGAEGSGGSAAMPPATAEGPPGPRAVAEGRAGGSATTPLPEPLGENGGAAAITLTDEISPISIASSPMLRDDEMEGARPCAEMSVVTVCSSIPSARSGGSTAAPQPARAVPPVDLADAAAVNGGATGGTAAPPAARETNVSMISISSEHSPATNDRSRSVVLRRAPEVYNMAQNDEDDDAVMKGEPAPMPHFQPGVVPPVDLVNLGTPVPVHDSSSMMSGLSDSSVGGRSRSRVAPLNEDQGEVRLRGRSRGSAGSAHTPGAAPGVGESGGSAPAPPAPVLAGGSRGSTPAPPAVPQAPGSWGAAPSGTPLGSAVRPSPYAESRSPSRGPPQPEAGRPPSPHPPVNEEDQGRACEAVQARAHAAAVEARAEAAVAEVRQSEHARMAVAEHAIRQAQSDAGVVRAEAERVVDQVRRCYGDEQAAFQMRIEAERVAAESRAMAERQAKVEGDRLLGQLQNTLSRVEKTAHEQEVALQERCRDVQLGAEQAAAASRGSQAVIGVAKQRAESPVPSLSPSSQALRKQLQETTLVHEERDRRREEAMAEMQRKLEEMANERKSRSPSRSPSTDLRQQFQQQREAFEEKERAKDHQLAAMQKQMDLLMQQLRTMQPAAGAPSVVAEDPPARPSVRLVGGCILRDDEPGPSGMSGGKSQRRAESPSVRRMVNEERGSRGSAPAPPVAVSGGSTPAPVHMGPVAKTKPGAADNPFNLISRPAEWMGWQRTRGGLDDRTKPLACPGSGGSAFAPGPTTLRPGAMDPGAPAVKSDGLAPGCAAAPYLHGPAPYEHYRPESGGSAPAPGLMAPLVSGHEASVPAEYAGLGNPFAGVPNPLNVTVHPAVTPSWGYPPAEGLQPVGNYGIEHHSSDQTGAPPTPPPRPTWCGGGSGGSPPVPPPGDRSSGDHRGRSGHLRRGRRGPPGDGGSSDPSTGSRETGISSYHERRGRRIGSRNRGKDSDKIREFVVPPLPQVPEFHEWRTRLQHVVASATYYPTEALAWLHEVDVLDIPQLGHSIQGHSRRFERLDYILGEALLRVITNLELLQEVQRWTSETQTRGLTILSGRQILKIIYKWYAVCEGSGAVYTMLDLTKLKLRNDGELAWFFNEWTKRVTHQRAYIPDEQLITIILPQLRVSKELSGDISHYDRTPECQTYEFLINSIRRYLARTHQEANRLAGERALEPYPGASENPFAGVPNPLSRPPAAAKPKAAAAVETATTTPPVHPNLRCWQCGGNHRKSDCPNRAGSGGSANAPGTGSPAPTPSSGGSTAARGGKGGGKGKGRGGGGKSNMPCWYWAQGNCQMGDDCRFVHDDAKKGAGLPDGVTAEMVQNSQQRAQSRSSSVASSAAAYLDVPPVPDVAQRKLCAAYKTAAGCLKGADCPASHDMTSWLKWRDYHMACQVRAAVAGGGRSAASSRTPADRTSETGQDMPGGGAAAAAWAPARSRTRKSAKQRGKMWRPRSSSAASGAPSQPGSESGGSATALRTWGAGAMNAPRAYENEDWESVPRGLPPSRAVASEFYDLGFEDMMGLDGPDGA